jgi:hypothetical protein
MASLGFGRDTNCTDSLKTGRTVTGLVLLGQACYRRLITPRGTLRGGEDESVYGLDLSGYVGRSPRNVEAALPAQIRAELLKDERVTDAATTITKTVSGPATTFTIRILVTASTGETFALVLAVDDVTTELLGIDTEATS